MRDMAASVRQRLLDQARASGQDFQRLLVRYGIERLAVPSSRAPATSRQQNVLFFPLKSRRTGRDDRGSDSSPLFVRLTAAVDHP